MDSVSRLNPPDHDAPSDYREEAGSVDLALRPVLGSLIGWSVLWLLAGATLMLLASWKFHAPDFLADCAFVTLGRIYPAATNSLIYGWGFDVSLAIGIWLLARLAGNAPAMNRLVTVSVWFWNFAVLAGIAGIVAGDSTGIEWFEMPRYVTPVLLVTFFLIGSWAITTLRVRRFSEMFISQWYVVAAIFWFAWVASASALMLFYFPVRGTVQSVVGAWYAEGLFSLWFNPIALGAIYYFAAKISARPVRYYTMAMLAFWSYGIFYSWLSAERLIGAPVPIWVQSAGVAATFLSLVPWLMLSVSLAVSVIQALKTTSGSATLKFLAFGVLAFVIGGLHRAIPVFGGFAAEAQLTFAAKAEAWMGFLGFFGMTAFGALYYIVPRVARRAWASSALVNIHWLASVAGVLVICLSLLFAGIHQGGQLADPSVTFSEIVKGASGLLLVASLGWVIFLVGQIAFAVNFFRTVAPLPSASIEPLVLPAPTEMEVSS